MKSVPCGRLPAWIATGLLLTGTSGCIHTQPFGGTPSKSAFQRPVQITSAHELSHVRPWGGAATGRPHSLLGSLFDRAMPTGGGCQATPRGLLQVAGVPNGAPAEDLYQLGFVRFGIAGIPVPVDAVLSLDHDVVRQRALASGAFLAQQGPLCSHSLFFYVTLGGGGDKDAVLVNR